MSKPDISVKTTFDLVNTVSFSPQQTRNVSKNLAEDLAKLGIEDPVFSITGKVGSGKSNLAEGLRSHYLPNEFAEKSTSRLLGRCRPAWQMWADAKTSLQIIDMAAMDHFTDPVMPALKPSNVQIFEHATSAVQMKSVAVFQIATGVDITASQDTRLISVYLNRELLSPSQRKDLYLRP